MYRATSSTGTYSYIATTSSKGYINGSLTTNRTYYYKVRAYLTVGGKRVYGTFSKAVSAKPIPVTPSSMKASSLSYNSIKVNWGAVSGSTGYQVYRATSSNGAYSYIGRTSSASLTVGRLTTNKTYYFKVKSYRMVGSTKVYSNYSSFVSV